MISIPDKQRPKSGRILEIAIVISVAVHLLLGGFATYQQPWLKKIMSRLVPPPKDEKHQMTALSTSIALEKRTRPQAVPHVRPQPQVRPVPPQPRVVPRVAVAPQPVVKPVPQRKPEPERPTARPAPTEIAKIVPHAKEVQAPQPVPSGDKPTKVERPTQVARVANPTQQNQISSQQIAEMEQRFAQTIAAARANQDPTRVPPQGPGSTMKRAHLDIEGVNQLMRGGEGVLTPREAFPATVNNKRGTCYYVDYQIQFTDGTFDQGPVYWPICYTEAGDPFARNARGFPLPAPQPGWQPTANQWQVIASHKLLRLYFPDKFPGGGDPPSGDAGN